jgi:hypothetical protein
MYCVIVRLRVNVILLALQPALALCKVRPVLCAAPLSVRFMGRGTRTTVWWGPADHGTYVGHYNATARDAAIATRPYSTRHRSLLLTCLTSFVVETTAGRQTGRRP